MTARRQCCRRFQDRSTSRRFGPPDERNGFGDPGPQIGQGHRRLRRLTRSRGSKQAQSVAELARMAPTHLDDYLSTWSLRAVHGLTLLQAWEPLRERD